MDWIDSEILKGIVNKIAFAVALWLVSKGWLATGQKQDFGNDIAGILIGVISVGVTWIQAYKHNHANKIIAAVNVTQPQAIVAAKALIDAPTPNDLPTAAPVTSNPTVLH